MLRLQGTVALVTGASRGAGKGIAVVLGSEGATVYVTGRSVRSAATAAGSDSSIEATAELVTARGGDGIPVRCDHTVDADVDALFVRIQHDHGRLDLLVNNAWGGYEDINRPPPFGSTPFWEQPVERWDRMFTAGVRSTFIASRLAVPLMLPQQRGPIVNTTFWARGTFVTNVPYDVAKAATSRLAFAMAHDLRPHRIAAVALSPGMLRSEGWVSAAALHAEYQQLTVTQHPLC